MLTKLESDLKHQSPSSIAHSQPVHHQTGISHTSTHTNPHLYSHASNHERERQSIINTNIDPLSDIHHSNKMGRRKSSINPARSSVIDSRQSPISARDRGFNDRSPSPSKTFSRDRSPPSSPPSKPPSRHSKKKQKNKTQPIQTTKLRNKQILLKSFKQTANGR
jgi:hypothetical protein